MIKFFRKIRQNLLSEGKTINYLKYAFGEIILVMIGILLALRVNNWNQDRINKKSEYKYLEDIKKEIQSNNYVLQTYIKNRLPVKIEGLLAAKKYNEENIEIKDTLAFLNLVSKGGMITSGFDILSRNTFDELVSTGNFQLIPEDSIKTTIKNYYWSLEADNITTKKYKSDITNFTSSLRPWNPAKPDYISNFDRKEMMIAIKSVEYRKIVNRELSFAYDLQDKIDGIDKRASKTIRLLDAVLKNK